MTRCDNCGRRLDRPGLSACLDARHPAPDRAQKIVAAIERDLRNRRGLRQAFEGIDEDLQDEIRDGWAALVRGIPA